MSVFAHNVPCYEDETRAAIAAAEKVGRCNLKPVETQTHVKCLWFQRLKVTCG
jgi:hypothetical protein